MTRVQAYLYLLIAFALIVGSFALFTQRPLYLHPGTRLSVEDTTPIPQPAYTPAVEAQLAASNGFEEVVSYTSRGFEPAKIAIPKGDTIRWTNNSHNDLWVAAGGGALYPGAQDVCGSSAFDSCRVIKSGEFWEFTFTKAGTWSYVNNMDKTKGGAVTVQ